MEWNVCYILQIFIIHYLNEKCKKRKAWKYTQNFPYIYTLHTFQLSIIFSSNFPSISVGGTYLQFLLWMKKQMKTQKFCVLCAVLEKILFSEKIFSNNKRFIFLLDPRDGKLWKLFEINIFFSFLLFVLK